MAFRKISRVESIATLHDSWSNRTASAKSHFAKVAFTGSSIKAVLESVASKYLISAEPADYIFVAMRAVTENEPNGNGDAFSREELLSWNKLESKPVYTTFEFKPHQVNHKAAEPKMARGVVIDTYYNEDDKDDCFVELLIAVDTKKDPILARGILDGTLDSFSMGCNALHTTCNVCGNRAQSATDYCSHIRSGKLKLHKTASGEEKLGFEWCHDVTFEEISSVDDPADKTALAREIITPQISDFIDQDTGVLELKARVRRLESREAATGEFSIAASTTQRGAQDSMNIEAKKKAQEPENVLASIYAKHHDLSFGSGKTALEETVKESGKSEDEVKQAWSKHMADSKPHADAPKIMQAFQAQLKACGDYKKAVKRTAEDHKVDGETVEKCADWMKGCYKMADFVMDAPAMVVGVDSKEEKDEKVEQKAGSEENQGKEDGSEKAGQEDSEEKVAAESSEQDEKTAGDMPAVVKEKIEEDKKDDKKDAQAVKEQVEPAVVAQEKVEEKEAQAVSPATDAQQDKESSEKVEEKSPSEMGIKASVYPYAKSYADCTAHKTASGDIRVLRGATVQFVVPASSAKTASKNVAPVEILRSLGKVGMLATMRMFGGNRPGAIAKKADLGVAEGAISNMAGGRPIPPASVTDGAIRDDKGVHQVNPTSATAAGENADRVVDHDKKNLGNSDVRTEGVSNNKGNPVAGPNTAIPPEMSNNKVKHAPKNVGTNDVLADHTTDFVAQGLDPKTAALVKSRVATLLKKAQDDAKKSVEDGEKAVAEKVEKEVEAKVAQHIRVLERGLKLAARRFALNLEPCDLKYNLGEVLCTEHIASGFAGMDADLVIDVLERGFNTNAAMENTVSQMLKRANEFAAMPIEALAAIERDANNLSPIHPTSSQAPAVASDLGRRAAQGSLPVLRSASQIEAPAAPTAQETLRAAIGSPLARRFGK